MSKRKVNTNRPQISTEEILAKKDFASVMTGVKKVYKPYYKKPWFLNCIIVTTVAVVSTMVIMNYTGGKEKNVSAVDTTKKTVTVSYTYEPPKETPVARPFINPPIKGADIPYSTYKVSATKKGEIKHTSGTKIKIPKNAFVDEKGKPVDGEVEIKYREFHDIADVYLSGIPMTYDSAGQQYHFETAGMLDIKGFQNDKPVYIAPGKKLSFEMKSDDDRDMFNFYALDTAEKNWDYQGRDKIKAVAGAAADSVKISSEAEAVKKEFEPKIEKVSSELSAIRKDIVRIESTKPAEPRKVDAGKYHFNLEVNAKEYPELAVYKDVQFEVNDDSFQAKYYKITWDDAKLSKGSTKLSYNLTLVKGDEQHTFIVQPALEGKTYEAAKIDFDAKFEMYGSTLTKRKEDEAEKKREADSLNQVAAENYKMAIERSKDANAMNAEVYRIFTVKGFGIYNCDSPQNYPKGANVIAKFTGEDGKALSFWNLELAEKGRKAIFGYWDFTNFRYNPKANNVIFGITSEGYFAVGKINPDDPKSKDKTEQKFIMKVIDAKVKSKEDLKALLEI